MSKAAQQTSDRAPGEGFVVAWVSGAGKRDDETRRLLQETGTIIEDAPLSSLVDRVNRRAPDLVVLSGVAGSAPNGIVDDLAGRAPASHVPVVAIGPSMSAEPKARARYGLVARLDEDAAADELAKQLRTLLRALSRRPSRWRIPVRAGGLEVVVQQLTASHRTGLLVGRRGAIALGEDGVCPSPLSMTPKGSETLTLYERPRSRITVLTEPPRGEATAPSIEGARVLVVDADSERGATLAARLEHGGAQTRACAPDATALAASKSLDPTLIVVTGDALIGEGCAPLWDEPRLAAASLLVLSDDVVRANPKPVELLGPISMLCASELALAKTLRDGEAVAERLETLGTARWIKILGRVKDTVTMRVYAAAGRGRVDLAEGRMRGAAFRPADTRMGLVEGRAAIDVLMQLPFGRVLAGNPAKLRSLEGVRKSRKTSIVGRITPTKGTSRGAIAGELFVERVSKKATNLAAASMRSADELDKHEAVTQPPRAKSSLVVPKPSSPPPESDEPFDDDDLSALRRELGKVAGVSDYPPPPDADAVSARAELPTEPPAREKAKKKKRKPAKTKEVSREAKTDAPRKKKNKKKRETADSDPQKPISIAPLPRPAAVPGEAKKVADEAEGESSNTVLYALVAAVAIAVGVFAAYRLATGSGDDGPEELQPGPEVAQHETEPGPTPDPEPDVEPEPEPDVEPEPDPDPEIAVVDDGTPETPETPEQTEPPIEPPAAGTTVQDLVEGSLEAARAREYARSETLARQALALSPHNAQAAYRLAVALYRRQRYDEAISWAERSLDWDSTSALPASLIGDVNLRQGRFVSAAAAYERALSIEPNFGPARRQLEQLRARRGVGNAPPPRPRTPREQPAPQPNRTVVPPQGGAPPENPF